MVNTFHISWKTYICIELQMNSEFSLAFFWWSAKKYCQYSWQLALSWRQKTRRDREIESLDISAKSTNRVNAILAALLLLLQKKENAILLHTLRVIKPTRGVLKRIVIHKIRILCGLLLLMHLFAFLFNKIGTIPAHTTKFILLHFCAYESFSRFYFSIQSMLHFFLKANCEIIFSSLNMNNFWRIEMNTLHIYKNNEWIFIPHSTNLGYTGCL